MYPIIYKQNPIIAGHYTDQKSNLTMLSDFDFDVLNAIYLLTQQNLFFANIESYKHTKKIETSFSDIKNILKINSNRYSEMIKNSIENIFNTNITLKNFIHPLDGKKYKEYHTRIILAWGIQKNNENLLTLEFDEIFLLNILRHETTYTQIQIVNTREIKSKYGKRLYEYLLSIKYRKEITLDIESLNKLYGVTYKSISEHEKLILRFYEQMQSKLKFNYETHKKDKKITFKIEQ